MTSLPDDVLLAILSHLPPRDLSFVRQASKHFRRLSYERAVWAPLYRNSRLFLPPGPLLTHSAADLEHLVLRATKLDRNWNSSSPSPRAQRLIRAVKLPYHAIFLHNHYLILGGTSSFNVYDIEHSTHSPSLVAHLSDSSSTFSSYHHLPDASHSLGDYFLLAAYRKSKSLPQAAVVVWKVMPRSPHPPLLIAQAPLSPSLTSPYIKTAYDCLLIDSPAGNPSSALNTPTNLLHIPTNRLYTIPPSSHTDFQLSKYYKEYVITPHHLIVIHIAYQICSWPILFEAFYLPTDPLTGPELQKTHTGVCDIYFKEPLLLDFRPTPLTVPHQTIFTFIAVTDVPPTGVLAFDLHLLPDGSVDVSDIVNCGMNLDSAAIPFNMHATSSARRSARAISMTGAMFTRELRNCLSRYDVSCPDDLNKTILVRSLDLSDQPGIHDLAFDGIYGRVGLLLNSGDAIVLDYV